jgi:hypothetical protein
MVSEWYSFSLQIFITDYFFKATLDENFGVADIEVIVLAICARLQTYAILWSKCCEKIVNSGIYGNANKLETKNHSSQ